MLNSHKSIELLPALKLLLIHKHVSRAATDMGITQSAMSRILSKLRDQFKDDLLVRSGNEYLLTPKAVGLKQQLNLLLPQLEQLWDKEALCPTKSNQVVSISGLDLDIILLAEKLKSIQRQSPNLQLSIINSSRIILDSLLSGEVDFALTVSDDDRPGLYRQVVTEDSFVAIVDGDSALTVENFDMQAYLAHNHGQFKTTSYIQFKGLVDSALAQLGVKRKVTLRLPSITQVPPLLIGSNLIYTLPRAFAEYLAKQNPIKILPLPFHIPPTKLYLYWHQRNHKSPLHQWIKNILIA